MKTVKVVIEGTSPYLMHKFSDEAAAGRTTRATLVEQRVPREEAEKVAYRDQDGGLYFNGYSIAKAIASAGGAHKQRGSRKSLKYVVPAAVRIVDDAVKLRKLDGRVQKDFEVDSRPVTIPATKGRVLRHRPRFDEWRAEFELKIFENLIEPKTVHQLLNEAGEQVGIGDFRPEKSGPFGCFRVVEWKELV